MLNMGMSNLNFNANSSVKVTDEAGKETTISIASFGSSYSGDQIYLNYNIMNKKYYNDNKEEIDADFEEFKNNVINAINNLN
jgi:hypothetical protein